MVHETLVAKNIITLPYNFFAPYELEVKPYYGEMIIIVATIHEKVIKLKIGLHLNV